MNAFVTLGCGLLIVVGGILWLRWHPFLALVLGALAVALWTPDTTLQEHARQRVARGEWTAAAAGKFVNKSAGTRVADEFGRTCATLGILIALATIIGEGGSGGALAQSPSDASPEEGPLPGDLETAKLFGERVVAITNQFVRGRQ